MNDIRRALDDLVGTPPVNLGRRGAVMSRINRVHHRRKVATQVTLAVAFVAGASFGAAQVITATPAGSDKLYVAPVETTAPDVAKETAKPEPTTKPATKPAGPKPTASPDKPSDPGTKPDPKPYYEPTTKPYVPKPTTKPYEPKPTVAADGLSVELWPYTDAVAGQSMDWKVKAYDGAGSLLKVTVLFGDGKQAVYEPGVACGEGVSLKKFFAHTYAAAGTYTGKATVTTGGCGAATETKTVSGTVKVLAAGSGNGPALPTVSAEQVAAEVAKLALHGADADGFVKKFWVDWGDGSPESVIGPRSLDSCTDGAASSWDQTATHSYAEPGTYTVKVTVMSVNCDAGQGQTRTISLSVTV